MLGLGIYLTDNSALTTRGSQGEAALIASSQRGSRGAKGKAQCCVYVLHVINERRCECGCRRIDSEEERQTSYIRSLRTLVRQRKGSASASYSSRRSHLRSSLNKMCGSEADERHTSANDTKQASSMVAQIKQTNLGKVSFEERDGPGQLEEPKVRVSIMVADEKVNSGMAKDAFHIGDTE
jgi:hypothetical protein